MNYDPFESEGMASTQPKEREKQRTRRFPPYHLILKNDDFHSFEFVINVLRKALSHSEEQAVMLTHEAHHSGRAVVWTGPKEVAEFRLEQIQTYHEIRDDGAKLGPLDCELEPAPGE